jgi:hypothetical protein
MPHYADTLSQPIKTPAGKQEMLWITELLTSLMKTVRDWQAGSARTLHTWHSQERNCGWKSIMTSSVLLLLFSVSISLLPPPPQFPTSLPSTSFLVLFSLHVVHAKPLN